LAATVCQIQLLTDPYRIVRPPTGHQPTFGSSSYPGVPSATVAIADSRQSMFIQSCSTTVSREKDCHEMRMQCRWNSAREQRQQQHSLSGNIPTAPHNSETYRSQMELSRKQQTTQRWRIYRVKIGWRHWGNDENVSSLSPINCLCKSLIHDTPDAP